MSQVEMYLCITPFFPSQGNWRGAYVLDQVKAIQRNSDYEVVVFKTTPLNQKEEDYEIDGIKVRVIRPLLMPSYFLNGLTEGLVGRMFLKTLAQYHIDPNRIAYVHCHTASHAAFGIGVKKVNPNAKVLIQFHDLDPFTLRNGFWADKRWNRRYRAKKSISAFNRADMLVCISEPVKDVILSFPNPRKGEVYQNALQMYSDLKGLPSVHPKNVYVLNNGVETSLFNEKLDENSFGADANENFRELSTNLFVNYSSEGGLNTNLPTSTNERIYEKLWDIYDDSRLEQKDSFNSCFKEKIFRIGCIANFQELKDHITLIKAFEILINKGYTNMRLSLLGSGETKEQCIQYLQEHNLMQYVEFPKEMQHNQLPDYYRTLNLFVLPSIYEGFGCVYTEAYACGVPFMGVFNQGAAECIAEEDQTNWLIQAHDCIQLANLIEKQYLEPKIQKLVKPYDIDALIKDFLNQLIQL